MTLTEIDNKIRQIFNVLDVDVNVDSSVRMNFEFQEYFEFWKRGNSYSVICPLRTGPDLFEEKLFNDGVFYSELRQNVDLLYFEITVLNIDFKDNFIMIVSDIIFKCFESKHSFKLVIERYQSWRDFIKLLSLPKTDVGLLGELFLLNYLIDKNIANVNSWTGPEFSTHDFNLGDKFVEVKTTATKYKNLISINGVMQLDEDDSLALCYVRVEKNMANGNSLKELVKEISEKLNSVDRATFNNKLKRFNTIIENSTEKFSVSKVSVYDVDDEFPKINERSFKNNRVPRGISYLSYMVDLSNLKYQDLTEYFREV
jgi:hypothetical protein